MKEEPDENEPLFNSDYQTNEHLEKINDLKDSLNNDDNNNYNNQSHKLKFDDYDNENDSENYLKKKDDISKLDYLFYYYMKFVYRYYIFSAIIIIVYILYLFFDFGFQFYTFYFWFTTILIISMIILGLSKMKEYNKIPLDDNYNEESSNLDKNFWINFIILFLSICSFIFLIKEHCLELKIKKFVGIFIMFHYIITLFLEIIALLYFDHSNSFLNIKKKEGYTSLDSKEERVRIMKIE